MSARMTTIVAGPEEIFATIERKRGEERNP